MPRARKASHAGSWYSSNGPQLSKQLQGWLDAVTPSAGAARAIIAPHAGYSYSGPTAAHAYKHIEPRGITRVFVLGPSHHVYLKNCAVTACDTYETPIGAIPVDRATTEQLLQTGEFGVMDQATDEDEHSIEMHLAYVHHVMRGQAYSLVPILVGALGQAEEAKYGKLLAPFLDDPATLFVISSDFCHWGRRFQYTYYDTRYAQICQCIEALDRNGMDLIEQQDVEGFYTYQREYKNTICGQHPIAVLLHALPAAQTRHDVRFVQYAQSSAVKRKEESSVSYASAVVTRATTSAG